ncbi:hypothetical protein D0T25_17810 [Duganella sp. BJB488]|uniref:Uncharacterized protein n=1 Tax=Duganella vulcania TaxID=2692166 RepID=A0A845HVK6_9BURK|nr:MULTISPECIES: hypothetical protein [Duganella]MYN20824.1 hypothetical protein [Duganella vulcania]RFP16735.1 hypothetical protein D0T26_17720 [Duganella sp. BJB489]RFP20843.1 hypothetical protein D0T25_17810 [Duganella sp. BJB488]RFP32096.1 hypothetical protein D0T24_21095 [Duganella sp. BJB480]
MHFEVPKAKTLKEFGGEYLMIVISIATALALEHGVQTLHHRHLAHEAADKIDAEIQVNVHELDEALKHNNDQLKIVQATREQLLAGIRDKVDGKVLLKQLTEQQHNKLGLSIMTPSLRREAWEVAVASQAVSWMPQDQLERYSGIYANMRDVQSISASGANNFLDGAGMLNIISDIQMGDGDAKAVYRMLSQMISAYASTDGNLQALRDNLAKSAKEAPHT